jgi:hypothetical protein
MAPPCTAANTGSRVFSSAEKVSLQVEQVAAHVGALAADLALAASLEVAPATREDREIHAGAEVLAGRGEDDDPGLAAAIQLSQEARQFRLEGGNHRIVVLRTIQADLRHLVRNIDRKAFVVHREEIEASTVSGKRHVGTAG